METLLARYRGLIVLVLLLAAQLVILGVQVRNRQDVRLIRVWAVSAVTPFAMILDGGRAAVANAIDTYVDLRGARIESDQLKKEVDTLRRQNEFLRAELSTADRADLLIEFKQRIPSRTIAARVIGTNAAPSSRVVFIDRGTSDGVLGGMAVINSLGVVGRVLDSYPATAQVMLITDPSFAMGVISQKGRVLGTLRGLGQRRCMVDYVESHLIVEKDEWFYTSGDDRVFPRGLPVGQVTEVGEGNNFQDIFLEPAGMNQGVDEVLIVLEAVHQAVPAEAPAVAPLIAPPLEKEAADLPEVSMGETSAPTPEEAAEQAAIPSAAPVRRPLATDADRLLDRYRRIGESQDHPFGGGTVGTQAPDFNRPPAPRTAGQAGGDPAGALAPSGAAQNPAVPSEKPPAVPATNPSVAGAKTQRGEQATSAPSASPPPAAVKPRVVPDPQSESVPPRQADPPEER